MSLIRLLTDFDGRIGRRAFWFGSIVVALMVSGVQEGATRIGGGHGPQVEAFAGTFALFPWAAIAAKRADDRGHGGLYGIVLVCGIVLLQLSAPLAQPDLARGLNLAGLLLWIVALVDLGLLPGTDATSVARAGDAAKRTR